VAPKPNAWKRINWSRWGNDKKDGEKEDGDETQGNGNGSGGSYGWGDETADEDGELVLQEVQGNDSWGTGDSSASVGWGSGWGNGESTVSAGWGSDDKYKPPHIKALEEKAQIEAIGW
jgi:hypothetical protein